MCRDEARVSTRALEKARSLLRHGLHPEQALIGTGLLTPEAYGEILSRIFDLPFVRLMDGRRSGDRHLLDAEMIRAQRIHLLERDGRSLQIGFVDPCAWHVVEGELATQGFHVAPAVILWSEWRRWYPPRVEASFSIADVARALETYAEHHAMHHLQVFAHGSEVKIHADAPGQRLHPVFEAPRLTPALLPAFALYLSREAPARGWQVTSTMTTHGQAIHLTRKQPFAAATHPFDWMQTFTSIAGGTHRFILILDADPYVRARLLERFPHAVSPEHWRRAAQTPHIYDGSQEEEREWAWQAALQGQPVIALASSAHEEWWKPVVEAHLPIQRISAQRHPEGVAWEACPL